MLSGPGERFLATVTGAVLSNQQPCYLLSPDVPISSDHALDGLNSLLFLLVSYVPLATQKRPEAPDERLRVIFIRFGTH